MHKQLITMEKNTNLNNAELSKINAEKEKIILETQIIKKQLKFYDYKNLTKVGLGLLAFIGATYLISDKIIWPIYNKDSIAAEIVNLKKECWKLIY